MIAVFIMTIGDYVACVFVLLMGFLVTVVWLNNRRWERRKRDEINEEQARYEAKVEAATPEPPKLYGMYVKDNITYDLIAGSCSDCVAADDPETCRALPNCLVSHLIDTAWVRRNTA